MKYLKIENTYEISLKYFMLHIPHHYPLKLDIQKLSKTFLVNIKQIFFVLFAESKKKSKLR